MSSLSLAPRHPQGSLSWTRHISCCRFCGSVMSSLGVEAEFTCDFKNLKTRAFYVSSQHAAVSFRKKKLYTWQTAEAERKDAVDLYGEKEAKGRWKTQTCQLDGKLTVLFKKKRAALWFVTTSVSHFRNLVFNGNGKTTGRLPGCAWSFFTVKLN